MYTLLLSIGLTTLISVVPMLFGVDAWKTILPGFFVGINQAFPSHCHRDHVCPAVLKAFLHLFEGRVLARAHDKP